ncbi:hypothetical protein [Paraliobacillus sp. X-1268]|uniref:hypothetical protein n=1 Tax=Paraliobacillus sp. X-1268 TaxID=2213193 RepID=UPI000E3E62C5|nr:hypothetical protein [Paraliobacillus sp. X-1268]
MKFKISSIYLIVFVGFYLGFIILNALADKYNISFLYVVNVKENGAEIFPSIFPFLIMFFYLLGSLKLISKMKEKT